MLSPAWVVSNVARLWIVILPLCTIIFVLLPSSNSNISLPSISTIKQTPQKLYHAATVSSKDTFISSFLENEIDGPFDSTALVELCDSKKWIPGLIIECEPATGGIANIRNIFLNCLRYAIEAATGFVLPTLSITKTTKAVPMDHYFDTAYFIQQLSTSCPLMKIYPSINDLWEYPSTSPPVKVSPEQFGGSIIHNTIITNPSNWMVAFHARISTIHPAPYGTEIPILVSLQPPLILQWPMNYDSPAFSATFGRLLRFSAEIKHLAATVLYALSTQYSLSLSFKSGIKPDLFYAAHLRTSKDAQIAERTSYDTQSRNYLDHAERSKLSLIYATAGNTDDLVKFAGEAEQRGISVTTKEQLLGRVEYESEAGRMRGLNWETRAAVDWEVMLWASQFGAIWESSFSWGVAVRRHVVDGKGVRKGLEGREGLDWRREGMVRRGYPEEKKQDVEGKEAEVDEAQLVKDKPKDDQEKANDHEDEDDADDDDKDQQAASQKVPISKDKSSEKATASKGDALSKSDTKDAGAEPASKSKPDLQSELAPPEENSSSPQSHSESEHVPKLNSEKPNTEVKDTQSIPDGKSVEEGDEKYTGKLAEDIQNPTGDGEVEGQATVSDNNEEVKLIEKEALQDSLSIIFGPVAEGRMFIGAMWP